MSLFRSFAKSKSPPRPVAPRRFRPLVDGLEARRVLSTLVVTSPDDSGSGTLREAVALAPSGSTITFAPSLDGQTITITSGRISEVGKSLTIQGPGAGALTISGGGTSALLGFDNGGAGSPAIDVSISGLTFADGESADYGGAISASGANLTLSDDAFLRNAAVAGGGAVYASGLSETNPTTLTVSDTSFLDNTAAGAPYGAVGGGLYANLTVPTLNRTRFDGNSSTYVGGGAQITANTLAVTDSTFTGNSGGGGLSFWGVRSYPGPEPVATIAGSLFDGNSTAGYGGGAVIGGNAVITGTTFENNLASGLDFGEAGALLVDLGATIDGCQFLDNVVRGLYGASGGALGLGGGLNSVVRNTLFQGNQAIAPGPTGGAVYVWTFGAIYGQRTLRFEGDTFRDNAARIESPEFAFAAYGGAIDIHEYGGQATIEDSTFEGNLASGGATPATPGGAALGGALVATGGLALGGTMGLTIRGTTFRDNAASAGFNGGVPALGGAVFTAAFPAFAVEDSRFQGNVARGGGASGPFASAGGAQGGAIASFDYANSATGTQFLHNAAIGGDGAAGASGGPALGGAIFGPGSFVDSLFQGNQAIGGAGGAASGGGVGGRGGDARGGAISSYYGDLVAHSDKFLDNAALGGAGGSGGSTGTGGAGGAGMGGAIFASGGTLDVLDVLFVNNQAIGGAGAPPGLDGGGFGGAIANLGSVATIKRTKFNHNRASTSDDDVYGPYSS